MLSGSKYIFKFKVSEGKKYIFDEFRKKYVVLTPEEWVRQNMLKVLVCELNYPASLIAVEYAFVKNNVKHRSDALVFDKTGKPWMLLEFKASDIGLTQIVLDQASVYLKHAETPYLVLSNGIETMCYKVSPDGIIFQNELPKYGTL